MTDLHDTGLFDTLDYNQRPFSVNDQHKYIEYISHYQWIASMGWHCGQIVDTDLCRFTTGNGMNFTLEALRYFRINHRDQRVF